MQIAVFGDLHGHLLSAFIWCVRWQQKTGQPLDLILQVGDLGAFPDRARLDRATRRHSNNDPAVLSFAQYFTGVHPEIATVLGAITCPLLFVRGNHEDHGWLDMLEQRTAGPCFSVDAYQRLWCFPRDAQRAAQEQPAQEKRVSSQGSKCLSPQKEASCSHLWLIAYEPPPPSLSPRTLQSRPT